MVHRTILVVGVAVLVSPPARAERLEFAHGGTLDGPLRVEGDRVHYEGPLGPCTFAREDVRAVHPGHWPPSEWPSRWQSVQDSDCSARFAAAWWALENGLIDECAAALRTIHDDDPDHQPTARLVALLDALAHPRPDPDLRDAAALIGGVGRVDRSEHILLVHAMGPEDASSRLAMLERVLTAYCLSIAAYGLDLEQPRERLVVVWMPDRGSYRSRLASAGAGDLAATRGYFHPTLQVILTYDGRSEPDHRENLLSIGRRRDQLDRLEGLLRSRRPGVRLRLGLPGEPHEGWSGPEAARAALDAARRDLVRRRLLLDAERVEIEYGAAAHELVHALVRATGLAPTHEDFPLWLHEGLAMQFEVVRGGRWAGVGRINPHRLAYWPRAGAPTRLDPILSDRGFGGGYRPDAYADAWALVYFLRKEHPDSFIGMLDRLRRPGADPLPPTRICQEALAAIRPAQDGSSLEADWHLFMERLAADHAAR